MYTGTLASEISLLLRRLFLRSSVDARSVLGMATSATLGSGQPEPLRNFAAQLFSKQPDDVRVVQGKRRQLDLTPPQPPNWATSSAAGCRPPARRRFPPSPPTPRGSPAASRRAR